MNFSLQLKQFCLSGHFINLFVPEEHEVQEIYRKGQVDFPYWSKVWPAALALSEFVLHYPEFIRQKKLIELGAGLGLPSIAAARYANEVICSDYLPEALSAIKQSIEHNTLSNVSVCLLNWRSLPADLSADVLLLSDINYEPSNFDLQQEVIKGFLKKGTTVLLSTPQRLMAKTFILPLLLYCKHQEEILVQQDGKEVMISVFVLEQDRD
jgi:predicted nicotinamide N-methyase